MTQFTYLENIMHETQELPPESILSQTLMQNSDLRAIMFNFAAGQELSEHTAAKPALLYFLRGEADVLLGGSAFQAGPNTFVHMEPHLPHSITAKTEVSMLLILLEK